MGLSNISEWIFRELGLCSLAAAQAQDVHDELVPAKLRQIHLPSSS